MLLLLLLVSIVSDIYGRCLCNMPKYLLEQQQQKTVIKEIPEVPVPVKETVIVPTVEHTEKVTETVKEVPVEQSAPVIVPTTIEKAPKQKRSPKSPLKSYIPGIVGAATLSALGYMIGQGGPRLISGGSAPSLGSFPAEVAALRDRTERMQAEIDGLKSRPAAERAPDDAFRPRPDTHVPGIPDLNDLPPDLSRQNLAPELNAALEPNIDQKNPSQFQ